MKLFSFTDLLLIIPRENPSVDIFSHKWQMLALYFSLLVPTRTINVLEKGLAFETIQQISAPV